MGHHSPKLGFELTQQNAGAVTDSCRKLDGIPLAIELATGRVGALSVGQIAGRLDDSPGFLTKGERTRAPRQRTLKGTLDWSYDLLPEPERISFARLSVFAGDGLWRPPSRWLQAKASMRVRS